MGDFDVTATAEALAVVVPKLRRRLREHGSLGDLTPSQVAVLLRIERDGRSTAARLAQAESMRPQSMGAIVAALQEMKFLESSPDPDDRRQSILSLTASCKRRIKVNRAARRDWLSQLIQAKFTAAEQKQLSQCVGLLRRLADDGTGVTMTITTIDPKTALVLIDLQKGIVSFPTAHPIDGVIKNAAALAAAFRARALPVVLVNVTGGAPGRTDSLRFLGPFPDGWAELVPELDQQPSDLVITKLTWGAFHATELEDRLKALGVTQIVLGGVSTSIGVETTARQAYERGLNVTLATDAMTDMAPEAHENSLMRIFPRLGESGSTQEIIAKLSQAVM